jgi:hypothetical protein
MIACAAGLAATMFAFASPAAADTPPPPPTVHGVVSWDVVHATAGYVTLFGQTQFQIAQVPLVVDPSGLSGSYTTTVPVEDNYSLFVMIGDCPDAATGNAFMCDQFMYLSSNPPFPFATAGQTTEMDFIPPDGFGPVAASGNAKLSGTNAIGGTAQFSFLASDAKSSIEGFVTVPIDGSGNYSATIGSGFSVGVGVQPQQVACVVQQYLSTFTSDVAAGSSVELDVSGDALPPAPAPGAIHLDFGVTGVAGVVGTFYQPVFFGQEDCAGGWNDPQLIDVPAGAYLMPSLFSGSTSMSPGPYQPIASFVGPNTDPNVQLQYSYPDRTVTVTSGQTTEADYRIAAAFLNINAPIDWGQFGALDLGQSNLQFAAYSSAPPGSQFGAASLYNVYVGGGVQTYAFQMPIDPTLQWGFAGATFVLFSADDNEFKNINLIPGVFSPTGTVPPVPALAPGRSANYDFTALAKIGAGYLEYAPKAQPFYGPFLNGNGSQVVAGQGLQLETLHYNTPFGAPAATATVMPGQQTLSVSWYDSNFNILNDSVNLDIRPNETVSMSENAPHLDNVLPVPGNICTPSLKVTGIATDPVQGLDVTVNGVDANVRNDGSFSSNVKIPVGDSTIVVRATDRNGNVIVRTRPIHRNADNSGCN